MKIFVHTLSTRVHMQMFLYDNIGYIPQGQTVKVVVYQFIQSERMSLIGLSKTNCSMNMIFNNDSTRLNFREKQFILHVIL